MDVVPHQQREYRNMKFNIISEIPIRNSKKKWAADFFLDSNEYNGKPWFLIPNEITFAV